MTSKGGCGDAVRNITGCAGRRASTPTSCSTAAPSSTRCVNYFINHDEYLDLPRKHKITMATCADQCNAPEINCIAFIGDDRPGRPRSASRCASAAASPRRRASPRDLGVFVAARRGAGGRQGDPGRLAPRPEVPGVAGQGAAEVPGGRLRRRGRPQGGRGAARPHAGRPGARRCPTGDARSPGRPPAEASRDWSTSACRSSLGQVNGDQAIQSPTWRRVRRRHPPHPPAELHPDRRPRDARRRGHRAARRDRLRRWTSTGCAAPASPAPASRSATSRWPRPSRRCSEIVERLEDGSAARSRG